MRLALFALALAGCTAIADFPEELLDESTEALCANGLDDDRDGLTDCQDWKCGDRETCCTIPSVVFEDEFNGPGCAPATCGQVDRSCAPDDERWQKWGSPDPYECEGSLAFAKQELCYPIGVLSRDAMQLAPGLRLEARVGGRPEEAGSLRVGLTTESVAIGAVDPCAQIAPASTVLAIVMAAAPGGVRFIALVEDEAIADVVVPQEPSYEVSIEIDDDRAVHFVVGDDELAIRAGLVPEAPVDVHVLLRGLGDQVKVDRVRVVAGTQCDRPAAWVGAPVFAPIEPPPEANTWDSFDRSFPNARLAADGSVHLSYSGCFSAGTPVCDQFSIGVAAAIAPSGGTFERPPEAAFLARDLANGNNLQLDWDVIPDEQNGYSAYFGSVWFNGWIQRVDVDPDGYPASVPVSVILGVPGTWRAYVSEPSALIFEEGAPTQMWFSALSEQDQTLRIAYAVDSDHGFQPALDPVLEPSEPYDSRGVSAPAVIYDDVRHLYRMWYEAIGPFGIHSIAYAVSTDGLTWIKYPGNPVIEPGDLGLVQVGSPTVIDDDGRLRMWVHGLAPGEAGRSIYELVHVGEPFVSP